jgi:hypothetical protein
MKRAQSASPLLQPQFPLQRSAATTEMDSSEQVCRRELLILTAQVPESWRTNVQEFRLAVNVFVIPNEVRNPYCTRNALGQ